MIQCGALATPFAVGPRRFARFIAASYTMSKLRKQYAPGPHWYLQMLGVDPQFQGRGLGSALLREGLKRADAASRPSYVETMLERNLAFYGHHGFDVMGSIAVGPGGPVGWAMRREVHV
jgi:ribosomal protein S18 acetylase RimI-like enzyme